MSTQKEQNRDENETVTQRTWKHGGVADWQIRCRYCMRFTNTKTKPNFVREIAKIEKEWRFQKKLAFSHLLDVSRWYPDESKML